MAGLPEAMPMTRRDRDHRGTPLDVAQVGIVMLVVLVGVLAGRVLPGTHFAQVAP